MELKFLNSGKLLFISITVINLYIFCKNVLWTVHFGFLGNLNALVLFAINVNQVQVVKVTVFGATPFSTSVNNNIFAYSIY